MNKSVLKELEKRIVEITNPDMADTLISDLPNGLKELAELRRKQSGLRRKQSGWPNYEPEKLRNAFWRAVCNLQEYHLYDQLYPNHGEWYTPEVTYNNYSE